MFRLVEDSPNELGNPQAFISSFFSSFVFFFVGGVHYCFEVKITETLDYSSVIETIYAFKDTKKIKIESSISPFCGFINTRNIISFLCLCKTPI